MRYPVGLKFRRIRSISHGLGDRHIYVFCYVAITQEIKAQSSKAAITQIATKLSSTKSYPAQTIDPIILHINFCEDRKHCFIKMFRKSQLKRA